VRTLSAIDDQSATRTPPDCASRGWNRCLLVASHHFSGAFPAINRQYDVIPGCTVVVGHLHTTNWGQLALPRYCVVSADGSDVVRVACAARSSASATTAVGNSASGTASRPDAVRSACGVSKGLVQHRRTVLGFTD
jgi:hypothetical protein